MATEGKVPVQESAGEAVRFLRENWRFALIVAGIGAVASTAAQAVLGNNPIGTLLLLAINAAIYAALIGAFLFGSGAVQSRLPQDALRNFGAMGVVGFFLFIVIMVGMIPGALVLGVTLAPYGSQIEAASQDQAAMMALITQIAANEPEVFLILALIYFVIWMMLTSRLFLAGPASVDQGRVLAFDTWKWTKNNMMRIIAARIILLAPALVLVGAFQWVVVRVLGVDAGAMSAGMLIAFFTGQFVTYAIYVPLEGALAAYLYRGLKPDSAAPPV